MGQYLFTEFLKSNRRSSIRKMFKMVVGCKRNLWTGRAPSFGFGISFKKMTSILVKVCNIPEGLDEKELAHTLADAMESSIKNRFISCQILHKELAAVLEFESTVTLDPQWSNLGNITINGKTLQILSDLNPAHQMSSTNGFEVSLSKSSTIDESMDIDEGVESGESSPRVPDGNEEYLKMLGTEQNNFPLSVAADKVETYKTDNSVPTSITTVAIPLESATDTLDEAVTVVPIPNATVHMESKSPVAMVGTVSASEDVHSAVPTKEISQITAKSKDKTKRSQTNNVQPEVPKTSRVVFFDLETTGLNINTCEIVQIAAVSGAKSYNVFIKPTRGIPEDASRINGLTVVGDNLLQHGKVVAATNSFVAWQGFIEFLQGLGNVILMGHYADRYDYPLLVRDIKHHNLIQDLKSVVTGLVDTIDVFRAKLPQRARSRGSFKQIDLARAYGISVKAAHDALGDVRILAQLCQKIGLASSDISKHRKMMKKYL